MSLVSAFESLQPSLHPSVFVAPQAVVVGRVEIGEGSSIWYGSVLRAEEEAVRIGARTNIQDLSVVHITNGVHGAWIGDDVTVGHRAIIHAATVHSNTLIGMGAIILDGAVIGENCLVGAGALVPPGKEIPSGSLVLGNPGRVVRRLQPDEMARITESAAHYVALAERHRKSLTTHPAHS